MGAVIGRYAGLIRAGKITIDGVDFPLTCNAESSHNDGGKIQFGKHTWNVEDGITHDGYPSLCCGYISPDGEEGYPGRLIATVNYILKDDSLIIDCKATTDKPTYCNITNRSYFNLHGCSNTSVTDHRLTVYADAYTGASGEPHRSSATETELDFRTEKTVGSVADGFDCSFVLDHRQTEQFDGLSLNLAAVCRTEERELTMLTSMPCLRIATGYKFDGAQPSIYGARSHLSQGLCMEAQYEPDSPARGLARLNPESPYHHITVFRLK